MQLCILLLFEAPQQARTKDSCVLSVSPRHLFPWKRIKSFRDLSLHPLLRSFSPSTSEKEICVLADLGEKILAQVKAVKQVDKDICIHRVVIKEQLDNTELEYATLLLKTIVCRENNVFLDEK